MKIAGLEACLFSGMKMIDKRIVYPFKMESFPGGVQSARTVNAGDIRILIQSPGQKI